MRRLVSGVGCSGRMPLRGADSCDPGVWVTLLSCLGGGEKGTLGGIVGVGVGCLSNSSMVLSFSRIAKLAVSKLYHGH